MRRPLGALVVTVGFFLLWLLMTVWWPADFVRPVVPPPRPIQPLGVYTSAEARR